MITYLDRYRKDSFYFISEMLDSLLEHSEGTPLHFIFITDQDSLHPIKVISN